MNLIRLKIMYAPENALNRWVVIVGCSALLEPAAAKLLGSRTSPHGDLVHETLMVDSGFIEVGRRALTY